MKTSHFYHAEIANISSMFVRFCVFHVIKLNRTNIDLKTGVCVCVQFLDEAVCVSLRLNVLEKGINLSLLPAMSK